MVDGPKRLLDLAFDAKGIDYRHRTVLLYVCRIANKSGQFFAAQETLAAKIEGSVSTVGRSIRFLCEMGILVPTCRGLRTTKNYKVNRAVLETMQIDVSGRSKRPSDIGQSDRQNPKNQKENQGPIVPTASAQVRRGVQKQIGAIINPMVAEIAEAHGRHSD